MVKAAPSTPSTPPTGRSAGRQQLGGVVRNVAIADGVLYALSDGNNAIYALDAATGEQLWDFVLDSGIDGGIAVHGGAAYVATAFGGIYAIGGTDQGAVPGPRHLLHRRASLRRSSQPSRRPRRPKLQVRQSRPVP